MTIGIRHLVILAVLPALAACGAPPVARGITDPNEAANREVHDFNKGLDRTILRPASGAYAAVVPAPVRRPISTLASNLDLPGDIVNDVLQGNAGDAGHNLFRLAVNATLGVGGLFDPAASIGLERRDTDFGETLHVWGAGEGNYVELPVLGPSTERDLAGRVVDAALNPMRLAIPADAQAARRAVNAGAVLDARDRFGDTIDATLYDSADSYAAARLLYLENRRFRLGQANGSPDAGPDPFADPFGDSNGN
ncbi:MAG: VacJ family lipoprotein [Rhodobacteraceae bacterium]|nr:VacJ family lipoprotein [Paracoccaceae bacterium]